MEGRGWMVEDKVWKVKLIEEIYNISSIGKDGVYIFTRAVFATFTNQTKKMGRPLAEGNVFLPTTLLILLTMCV